MNEEEVSVIDHMSDPRSWTYPPLHKVEKFWVSPPEVGVPKLHWLVDLGIGQ